MIKLRLPRPPKRAKAPSAPRISRLRVESWGKVDLPQDEQLDELERWKVWEATYAGSFLEFIVWEWLVKVKKQIPEVDFQYQSSFLGGRTQFGGFVADFVFPARRMIWNPAGLRWHHTDPADRARDMISRAILTNRGYLVIFLYEDDLINRRDYTLNKAWDGVEVGFRRF